MGRRRQHFAATTQVSSLTHISQLLLSLPTSTEDDVPPRAVSNDDPDAASDHPCHYGAAGRKQPPRQRGSGTVSADPLCCRCWLWRIQGPMLEIRTLPHL